MKLNRMSFMNHFRAIKVWVEIYFRWWPHSVESWIECDQCLIHLISHSIKETKVHFYDFYTKHEKGWKEGRCTGTWMIQKRVRAFVLPPFFYRSHIYNKNTPKDDFGQFLPKVDMKERGVDKDRLWVWLCHEQSLAFVFSRHARGFLLFWNYLSVLCDFIFCVSIGCGTSRGNNLHL